jgi:hypothetical protein
VMHSVRRRGIRLVLAVLPDGDRSLIPVDWTDWNEERSEQPPAADATRSAPIVGSLSDLLHLRKVVDALHGRPIKSAPCTAAMQMRLAFLDQTDPPRSPSTTIPTATA